MSLWYGCHVGYEQLAHSRQPSSMWLPHGVSSSCAPPQSRTAIGIHPMMSSRQLRWLHCAYYCTSSATRSALNLGFNFCYCILNLHPVFSASVPVVSLSTSVPWILKWRSFLVSSLRDVFFNLNSQLTFSKIEVRKLSIQLQLNERDMICGLRISLERWFRKIIATFETRCYSHVLKWMWTRIYMNDSDHQPNQSFVGDKKNSFTTIVY
jgi:hypothetical protein